MRTRNHTSLGQSRTRRDRTLGQAVAELAIVAPVLIVLMMALLQFAFIFMAQVGLTNAVRDVARAASAPRVATDANAAVDAQEFYLRMTTDPGGALARNVPTYAASGLVTAGSAGDLTVRRTRVCYYSFTDVTNHPAVMAYAEVQYVHPLFLPIISQILDPFDGVTDGGFRLGAVEEIRVGNIELQNTDIPNKATPTCNT